MRNWAGNVTFSTTDVRHPGSTEELQQVVAGARHVRALGTGHSFNPIADTTGTLVSTRDLGLGVEVLAGGEVAVVPGGATYAEVARALHERGLALHNMGSLPHISVAGAVSTATHGSGNTNGSLATAVVGLELVLADGSLLEVHEGDPRFAGMVVALGALGVVTRLWLRVEPAYDVRQEVVTDVHFDAAVEQVDAILASAHSVSIFSSFARPDLLDSIWRKHRVDPDRAEAEVEPGPWGGQPATAAQHPLRGMDASAATEQLGRPGPWHQRLPHFRTDVTPSVGDELQSELFLPREHAAAALRVLHDRSADIAGALQVFEMRTIAADDLWLSPFHGRDTVAVHATWVSDLALVRPALAALEEAVSRFDPRPHWGKVTLGFDADRLAGLYPSLPRFRALADDLDPERCFVNDHLTRLGLR
ncbi:FAD-binding protein [Nocardioides psychrotolerans]|uniref:FAD-binding protein n=1 Tax=Nocardioides psychrotolerans TaxID=1005945 RepID=UPI0031380807